MRKARGGRLTPDKPIPCIVCVLMNLCRASTHTPWTAHLLCGGGGGWWWWGGGGCWRWPTWAWYGEVWAVTWWWWWWHLQHNGQHTQATGEKGQLVQGRKLVANKAGVKVWEEGGSIVRQLPFGGAGCPPPPPHTHTEREHTAPSEQSATDIDTNTEMVGVQVWMGCHTRLPWKRTNYNHKHTHTHTR